MTSFTRLISTAFVISLASSVAWGDEAPDAANGKALHDKNCVSCHTNMTGGDGSVLYTRKDHRVTSPASLEAQVRRCESNLQLKWFDSDILDVAEHLNQTYYKFPKK
ncbi:MAG TPA: cytochrome c [Gammaproteobacteria bacterium]|nr:cytochrome c [Gammaproteobacteria bacterium]